MVELLVVITIIGILIALLLPAVQAAREAARNMQCSNNLKQLGVAMHGHHERKGGFPPGYYRPENAIANTSAGTNTNAGAEATWVTFLLPYLDQVPLYDMIQWDKGFGWALVGSMGYPNRQVTSVLLQTMRCPSSTAKHDLMYDAYAHGNYAANNGYGPLVEMEVFPWAISTRMAGAFKLETTQVGQRANDIKDGLSYTAFVSEIRIVGGSDMRGVMHYPEGPFYHHNYTPNDLMEDHARPGLCSNEDPMAPCQETPTRNVLITARSAHPQGVNLLLGDGSVRFVNDSISMSIWEALSTPSGGEPLFLD